MTECVVVIPARYGSTRFKGKVLADLKGRSVLQWCYRAAVKARVGPVLVATDDSRVLEAVSSFGGRGILTPSTCLSGTDRVYQALRRRPARFVINLQGDEPLMEPGTLRQVLEILRRESQADIATAVSPLCDLKRLRDPHTVKAVLAVNGRALYFSRSPVPFQRNGHPHHAFQHMGLYGFKWPALRRFVRLKPSPLESAERLEQLRALEAGMRIYAAVVPRPTIAIDTPQDLSRAKRFLNS